MDLVGTFPFGWIRNIGDDNWQIIWDPKKKLIYLKGSVSKRLVELGSCSSWEEAKSFSNSLISNPDRVRESIQ